MTHSLDSFITDSANSATALYTGKKASVSALNVYADSVSLVSAIERKEIAHTSLFNSLRIRLMIPRSKLLLNCSAGVLGVQLEWSLRLS